MPRSTCQQARTRRAARSSYPPANDRTNDGGSREEWTPDRAGGAAPAHHGDRRVGRDPRRRARALRPVPREGRPLDPRPTGRPARRQADHHDGDHADESGRGQDHHLALAHAGHGEDRQGRRALPPRALDGTGVRHQGRRHGWRLRAGGPDGGHQPPLQRRLPRGHGRPQPPGIGARRLALLREPAGDRRHAASRGRGRSTSTRASSATPSSASEARCTASRARTGS